MSETTKSEPLAMTVAEQTSAFELAQRRASAYASSMLVPANFRGAERVGDCLIALEIANRLNASPLAVMQSMYIVSGRPAWSSQFNISMVNQCKRFTGLRFQMVGEGGKPSYGCLAWTTDAQTGDRVEGTAVTLEMAEREGWSTKSGSKWKTMPDQMLKYRAAAFFARLYCPEVLLGILSQDEALDIQPVKEIVIQEPAESVKNGRKPREIHIINDTFENYHQNQKKVDEVRSILVNLTAEEAKKMDPDAVVDETKEGDDE